MRMCPARLILIHPRRTAQHSTATRGITLQRIDEYTPTTVLLRVWVGRHGCQRSNPTPVQTLLGPDPQKHGVCTQDLFASRHHFQSFLSKNDVDSQEVPSTVDSWIVPRLLPINNAPSYCSTPFLPKYKRTASVRSS